jgi:hypothetical protein
MNTDERSFGSSAFIRVYQRLSLLERQAAIQRAAANKECPQEWGHGSLDRLRYAAAAACEETNM